MKKSKRSTKTSGRSESPTMKYGPMRKVVRVLGKTKTTRRVKLDCGHTTHSRSATQRCGKCLRGK